MDWDLAIERNRLALKRVVAGLVAMAGLGDLDGAGAGDAPRTLPRRLHRAVLRLLRPAEAAARRLVIVAARGLVAPEAPAPPGLAAGPGRSPNPDGKEAGAAAIPSPFLGAAGGRRMTAARVRRMRGRRRAGDETGREAAAPRVPRLPLFDRLKPPRRRRRTAKSVPRILFPGFAKPHPVPPAPRPWDPLDASRLDLRLRALAAALDDLPSHARRFARWKARRDAAFCRRRDAPPLSSSRAGGWKGRTRPLRPGRPPGRHSPRSRRARHEVHGLLEELQSLAVWAIEPADTS